MTTSTAENPADIEREIRRTQENMSSTIDKIGDQLSIKNIFNALLDKADNSNVDARMVLDGARRNPVALGLIAAGAIWLISEKDAKFPDLKSKFSGKTGNGATYANDDHDDYELHMSSIRQEAEEDMAAFDRRRDTAQASYFKVKPEQGEDESKFRQRLNSLATTLRDKRRAFGESSGNAQQAAKDQAQAAAHKAQNLYDDNPLIGGILAMAAGAAVGSALPVTRREQETLRPLGEKALGVVNEHKEQVTSQLIEKKDALLEKADAALTKSTGSDEPTQPQPNPTMVQ